MSRILLPKFERYRAVIKETQKWTDKNSLYYKLPEHYKKRHKEFLSTVPKPVHYIKSEKLYEVDHETGTRFVFKYLISSFYSVENNIE